MTRKSYEQLEAELVYMTWQRDRAIETAIATVRHFETIVAWNKEGVYVDEKTINAARQHVVTMLAAAGMEVRDA